MMMKSVLVAAVAALAAPAWLAAPAFAAGTLLTSDTGYTGPGFDLSAYKNEVPDFSFGPLNIDGYTFTAAPGEIGSGLYPYGGNSGEGSYIGQDTLFGYGFGSNGEIALDTALVALDSGLGYMQLLGTTGYSQLGFLMNYAPGFGTSPTIWTLDQAGNIIDSFDLGALAPISTPDGFDEFGFRGVGYDDGTQIYGMRFGGSYLAITETPAGQGNPQPPVPGVPEPASWTLLIAGFGLIGLAARRRPPATRRLTA